MAQGFLSCPESLSLWQFYLSLLSSQLLAAPKEGQALLRSVENPIILIRGKQRIILSKKHVGQTCWAFHCREVVDILDLSSSFIDKMRYYLVEPGTGQVFLRWVLPSSLSRTLSPVMSRVILRAKWSTVLEIWASLFWFWVAHISLFWLLLFVQRIVENWLLNFARHKWCI